MKTRTRESRLHRLEEAAKVRSKFSAGCICFPKEEFPFFGFKIEEEVAAKVKCPLHGERHFVTFDYLYRPAWRRDPERQRPLSSFSRQFQKAWNASFPPGLWPAREEVVNGSIALRLKDGTVLSTNEPVNVIERTI